MEELSAFSRMSSVDHTATIRLPGLEEAINKDDAARSHPSDSVASVTSDESLLAEICQGSREALAIFFRRHARLVRNVAFRVLRDSAEADDLLQDIFVWIHRAARTFDSSKGSAQFWIVQMTYRRAFSRRQHLNSRHFYTSVELDEQLVQTVSPGLGKSDASLDQRLAELDLQKIFGSLSQDQQKTLRLHFIEGYTLDEIAKMLGQTKGNIRHHSFRGLEKLRKLIFAGDLPGTRAV
jgi:RNA polymerase sigma-70 factor, ECF subfamily